LEEDRDKMSNVKERIVVIVTLPPIGRQIFCGMWINLHVKEK
jgi:hypothetical protein